MYVNGEVESPIIWGFLCSSLFENVESMEVFHKVFYQL